MEATIGEITVWAELEKTVDRINCERGLVEEDEVHTFSLFIRIA